MPKNFSVDDFNKEISDVLTESISIKKEVINSDSISLLSQMAVTLLEALKRKGKIIIFGNGGSAADSLHIVAELVGRFEKERQPLPAVSLTSNISSVTALSNDYAYEDVFSRQLVALAKETDVAWGISTSGNSKNVICAINKARELGLPTIAFTGGDGGELKKVSDLAFVVPSFNTARIQEVHIVAAHALCKLIENFFVNE